MLAVDRPSYEDVLIRCARSFRNPFRTRSIITGALLVALFMARRGSQIEGNVLETVERDVGVGLVGIPVPSDLS